MGEDKKTIDELASKHLGSSGSYAVYTDHFDPSLLVAMPRSEAREQWNITDERFVGIDIWRAYESTFLLQNGFPVSGTLKIVVPASSEFIVESKSLKLYLNSFDMCKMGNSISAAAVSYVRQVSKDLSELLRCEVEVGFFTESTVQGIEGLCHLPFTTDSFGLLDSLIENVAETGGDFDDYESLRNHLRWSPLTFSEKEKVEGDTFLTGNYRTNLLRSRCRHTKQKDSGSAYITLRSDREISAGSLLKQIISLREVNEFHEFCCEKLFTQILNESIFLPKRGDKLIIKDLMVACLYARRGGIDINPIRATSWDLIPFEFRSVDYLCDKTIMQ